LKGERNNVIEMAKDWGRTYNQQGMALLIPNPKGTGGKLVWNFGRELSDHEMDLFFTNLDQVNKDLGEQFNDYFGVTTKGAKNIEYWYSSEQQKGNAQIVIQMALGKSNLAANYRSQNGFDFILLSQGEDY